MERRRWADTIVFVGILVLTGCWSAGNGGMGADPDTGADMDTDIDTDPDSAPDQIDGCEAEAEAIVCDEGVYGGDVSVQSESQLEALAGYNGVSKALDFADIRVTRDLHCWTASATYSMQQRSLQFNVGIKAFAVGTPALGHGIRGQSFDLEQGSLY